MREGSRLRGPPGPAEHGGPARQRVVLSAAAAIALCGAVALAASSSSAIAARSALEQYVVPGRKDYWIQYDENNAYLVVASDPDAAAGIKPKEYAEDGQWPAVQSSGQQRAAQNQRLLHLRLAQLAQTMPRPSNGAQAAADAAAALKREVQGRGGAHSPAMGVIRHVTRDLESSQNLHPDSGCDCSDQQQLRAVEQSLCDCAPPRLVNGEDCDEVSSSTSERTNGVRWKIDCESKWRPVRPPGPPPPARPEEEEVYTVEPVGAQQYADALEVPPGEEHPEIEKDEMGPTPDIFAPQEPWHKLKDYRNEWYYDYEAAPYTAQYDDESVHDQFSPEEPWNDRNVDIILDASFADMKSACLNAGEDHVWNSDRHECTYQGQPNYAEMPRGRGVTQEGPSRKAMDGERPVGDVYDDAKELDEFGARRPEPAGEVDQFGWRPAPEPARLRDTTLDYQTVDLEKACREQMQLPGKGMAYSWDPSQGKCLYLGSPARAEEQPPKTTHPLTDGIYADMKRDCLQRGGDWVYPRQDGNPGICEDDATRARRL